MEAMVRVASLINQVSPLSPESCCDSITELIDNVRSKLPDIIVFPSLSMCGASCGDMYKNKVLLRACKERLAELAMHTASINAYLLVGMPLLVGSKVISVTAVVQSGSVLGYVPGIDAPYGLRDTDSGEVLPLLPPSTVFRVGDARFCVAPCKEGNLMRYMPSLSSVDFDILISPSCEPSFAGHTDTVIENAAAVSRSFGCGYVLCCGGIGESTSPYIYKPYTAILECGELLSQRSECPAGIMDIADLDVDIIKASRQAADIHCDFSEVFHYVKECEKERGLIRKVPAMPYLPQDENDRDRYLDELFLLQARALGGRLKNIGLSRMVIGVSGGLDSTLALLVCAKACDMLGLEHTAVTAVTMPGLGTSDRTYLNALTLMDLLGVTERDISIKESVLKHFEDISHDSETHDTAYENAQARERTQVLFDISNMENALVVGTGDLSESAMGFCTYGGDHLAGYNVNSTLFKSVIRELLSYIAGTTGGGIAEVLYDILDTPVSPELLPTAGGGISQRTEDILGSYDLLDFYIYNFVKYGMSAEKLLSYAKVAFEDVYDEGYMRKKLDLAISRFFKNQFKRSCSPDGAAVTDISLSPQGFMMTGEGSGAFML